MNTNTLEKALAEVNAEIERLNMVNLALRNALNGHTMAVAPAAGANGAPKPAKKARRSWKTGKAKPATLATEGTDALGRRVPKLASHSPVPFVREVIAESRTPLDTKAIYERIAAKGWRQNPHTKTLRPENSVYMCLHRLAKNGEISRIGTEWQRA